MWGLKISWKFNDISENALPQFSGSKNKTRKQRAWAVSQPTSLSAWMFDLLFYPEDGGSTFLRKSINLCQTTRSHIPDSSILHNHRQGAPISHRHRIDQWIKIIWIVRRRRRSAWWFRVNWIAPFEDSLSWGSTDSVMTMLRWGAGSLCCRGWEQRPGRQMGKESYGKASVAEGLLGYTDRKVEVMGS
jgi:hypothetical protein